MKTTDYVRYESMETWLLYQEFCNIPGNKMDVNMRQWSTVSTQMMRDILNTAYKLVGRPEMIRVH